MGANWNAIENALWSFIQGASGLDAARVIWAEQYDNRPASGTFITLLLTESKAIGCVDEVQAVTDLAQPAGQEITQTVNARREFVLSVQAYQAPVVEASSTPITARSILSQIMIARSLPSPRGALFAAGISFFAGSEIRNVSTVLDTKYEGRAQMDLRFYTADSAMEQTGYIAAVNVNPETFNAP